LAWQEEELSDLKPLKPPHRPQPMPIHETRKKPRGAKMVRPQAPVVDPPPERPGAELREYSEDFAEKLTMEFSKLSDQLKVREAAAP